jgi:simple sugar transport system ATP-binding protein
MLRLELVDITKDYPGVRANDRVCLKVAPGEIHALLGENGAGKSTLMKLIYGVTEPDAGEIRFDGKPVRVANPEQARKLGIAMVFQHFSLFESLTVAQNVWLGVERSHTLASVVRRIREVTASYGLELDPSRPVHTLSVGERQRVEIVRALMQRPSLLILDEPTSVLTPQAVEKLFETLNQLAREGCSILYISHKLDEIRVLCHHATVLRAGRVTGEVDPTTVTTAELSRLMIGAEPPALEQRPHVPGDTALELEHLTLAPADAHAVALHDVSLHVKSGEILGIAGVSGNGQRELCAALSGERRDGARGSVRLFGADIARASPVRRRELGLRFVPEERLGRATVTTLSLADNTLLTRTENVERGGLIDRRGVRGLARRVIERFGVKARNERAPAKSLSGGNLQKFIVGRELDATPRVLVIAQPTWGVDVGAAAQIRGELSRLRDQGTAVLVVSEELDELFELCDYLAVMANGKLSPRVAAHALTRLQIGEWMSGLWPGQQARPRAGGAALASA